MPHNNDKARGLAYKSDPMNVKPKSAFMRKNFATMEPTSIMSVKPQESTASKHQQHSGVLGFVIPKVLFAGNEKIQVLSQGDPSLLEFAKLNAVKCPKEDFVGSTTSDSSFSTIISQNPARIPNQPINLQANAVFIGQEAKSKDKSSQERVSASKENLKASKKDEHPTSNDNRHLNRNKSKNNLKNKPKASASEERLACQKPFANKLTSNQHKEKLGTSREHQAHGGSGTNIALRESAESKTGHKAKQLKPRNKLQQPQQYDNHQQDNGKKYSKKDAIENVKKSNTKLSKK